MVREWLVLLLECSQQRPLGVGNCSPFPRGCR
jgi:hypothetical protein